MRFYLFYTLISLLAITNLKAQYLPNHTFNDFRSLTVEDGMSHNTVQCILKDKAGYVWFGTGQGLTRFDSYNLTHIIGSDENISNAVVFDMLEDSSRNIMWVATNMGLLTYDPLIEKLSVYDESKFFMDYQSISCIEMDESGYLWLGTTDGLYLLNPDVGVIEEYRHKPYQSQSISSSEVYSLLNEENTLWVGTEDGLNIFDKKSKNFQRFQLSALSRDAHEITTVRKILKLSDGRIAVGTEYSGLFIYDPVLGVSEAYNVQNGRLLHNDVRDVYESVNGDLLLATNGGGYNRLIKENGKLVAIKHSSLNPRSIATNAVYSVLEDDHGIVWLGTYLAGVFFNNSANNPFKNIRQQHYPLGTIVGNRIRSLYLDKEDNLWLGTLSGVTKYNYKSKLFDSYCTDGVNRSDLSFNTVTSVMEDSRGWKWVSTYSGGVNLLRPGKSKFEHITKNGPSGYRIKSDNVYCFYEDNNGNVWIGSSEGLDQYNAKNKTITNFLDLNIRDIKISENGVIVMAVWGGVVVMNLQSLTPRFLGTNGIAQFPTNEVYIQNENTIWFASQGGGFGSLKIKENEFKLYTKKQGLPSNYVSSMISYNDSLFWLSTYKGLSLFNRNTGIFTNFDIADGVPCYEFYPRSSVVLPDGQIAFGGSNGLVFFEPEELLKIKHEDPRVLITDFKLKNQKVVIGAEDSPLSKSVVFTNEIVLKYSQKDFSLDFIALNYNNPGDDQFEYQLEGYSKEWIDIGKQRTATFTNLNSGLYTFKIRTHNKGEHVKTELVNEASIQIKIKHPFWFSWWFVSIFFAVVGMSIWFTGMFRVIPLTQKRQIDLDRLEFKRQNEFNQMRLRFFTNISHELRTPLTLMKGPIGALMESTNNPDQIRMLKLIENGSNRLLRLVNQILDFRRVENDALELKVSETDIRLLLESIYQSFEDVAGQQAMKYDLKIDKRLGNVWVDIDKIEKILSNLLSNAFKYSGSGSSVLVEAKCDSETNKLILSVVDNGKGIEKDKTEKIFERYYQADTEFKPGGVGIGLTMVKSLVDLHKGTIRLESDIDQGAEFIVELPIDKASYSEDEITVVKGAVKKVEVPTTEFVKEDQEVEGAMKHDKNVPLILIVDDEPEVLKYLVTMLGLKFRVESGSNGKEGLEMAIKHKPDLILSDVVMPEMNGIEFCKQLKANDKIAHIPFLFLSAWTSDDFKMQGLETGADDYIVKPFNEGLLVKKITNIIENRKKLQKVSKKIVKVTPDSVDIVSSDDQLIINAQRIVEKYVDDPSFTSKRFREEMNMSHSLLYRKLKELTGFSSNEFIRDYRLKRAAQILMQDQKLTFNEVCAQTGFGDSKYFSQCFKKKFGINPSVFANMGIEEQEKVIDV